MEDVPRFIASARIAQNASFHYYMFSRCRGNVSAELVPSNGCLHSYYLKRERERERKTKERKKW
jgi:hypothetical protein